MRRGWRSWLFGCSLLVLSSLAWAEAEFVEQLAGRQLLPLLRQGGYVLYMRHGYTDNSKPDQIPVDLHNCATQRPLTSAGRQLSGRIGRYLRQARIPVGEVIASPMCRARESAEAAFPGRVRIDEQLMYTANLTLAEKQPILAATRRLLSTPVPGHSNRVVVAHAPNLFDLIGYFMEQEGTVVVIQPLANNQFRYIASIPPGLWPELLH